MSRQQVQREWPERGLYHQQLNCSKSTSTSCVEKYTSSLQTRRLARASADLHMPLLYGGKITCVFKRRGTADLHTGFPGQYGQKNGRSLPQSERKLMGRGWTHLNEEETEHEEANGKHGSNSCSTGTHLHFVCECVEAESLRAMCSRICVRLRFQGL